MTEVDPTDPFKGLQMTEQSFGPSDPRKGFPTTDDKRERKVNDWAATVGILGTIISILTFVLLMAKL
jgi:hypothetical protein